MQSGENFGNFIISLQSRSDSYLTGVFSRIEVLMLSQSIFQYGYTFF